MKVKKEHDIVSNKILFSFGSGRLEAYYSQRFEINSK